ncbi:MBL fold metallo-hydrolase [Pseudoroseicyclus tamaricis]|uniref:MBL fold metallo-hydrolase n=1 Tax=Pseudoroseicyclus tamaricis TaxID=2705421 RepID=A0A6B2JSN5_9RHOB|nr:MBL fold metallo-hydrolase [Pseudoroseicyclus tamaricis]NDV01238.1 MBL fold metallo-hydrolase [Pseudoroseicyclus tamaricis]
MLNLTIHGARGSLPGARSSAEFGTASICAVARGAGSAVILDAGSGAAAAGAALLEEGHVEIDLILSHLHLDHVISLPFLPQLLRGDGLVRVHLSQRYGPDPAAVLGELLRAPWFPVPLSGLRGRIEGHPIADGATLRVGGLSVETAPLNHPGGATGVRISDGAEAVAVLLDHEPGDDRIDAGVCRLMQGCRVAVMDAAWTPEEAPARAGWGHGCWEACIRLARRTDVAAILLSHHAPSRDDTALLHEEARARQAWSGARMARQDEVI